ncbi:MAG: aspartate kinase [Coxiellaceae bacterium]|nr:aspartate kinase [Coxiellaceae bacterium]
MAVLVQKFGGTSVRDIERIRAIASLIARTQREGHDVVVVVSAMAGETDRLVGLTQQASSLPSLREYDALVSSGEQISSALLAMVLIEMGVDARSYAGHQVPIITDSRHKKARIVSIDTDRLKQDLSEGVIPIIAGFQGVDAHGHVTTFGRGGSDITAVALAAAMSADECQMLTDVDGIYTADPRIVDSAQRLDFLTYEEMLELSSLGSKVLQIRSLEFAQKYGIPLRVLSSFEQGAGTLISREENKMEQAVVSGIAFDRNQAKISLMGASCQAELASRVLNVIGEAGIDVDLIVQNSPDSNGCVDFSFTVHRDDYTEALKLTEGVAEELGAERVCGSDRIAKISLVGVGMRSHAGVAATMFDCLNKEGVEIQLISTSEIKISAVIDEDNCANAIKGLHTAFKLDSQQTVLT